jgi:ubiquinone/menaquinone biosynthesis C-methylase UbiE
MNILNKIVLLIKSSTPVNILRKIYLSNRSSTPRNNARRPDSKEIEKYYDERTDGYIEDYGYILQAARPKSDEDLIKFIVNGIDPKEGMHLLDAGCGVCGPAIAIANNRNVTIEGITISQKQVDKSRENINKEGLTERIKVTKGDFQDLTDFYPTNHFDMVYFLESLGYAKDMKKVLKSAVRVLKPGGHIYIKDFFLVPLITRQQEKIRMQSIKEIRSQYLYKLANLPELIHELEALGLFIEFIRVPDFQGDFSKAATFEQNNTDHGVWSKAIQNSFQMYTHLEVKFRKVYY